MEVLIKEGGAESSKEILGENLKTAGSPYTIYVILLYKWVASLFVQLHQFFPLYLYIYFANKRTSPLLYLRESKGSGI